MNSAALRVLVCALLAAAGVLAATACTDASPASPSATSRHQQAGQDEARTAPSDRNTTMDIRLTVDGHPVDATLNDSAAARDFAALLPLALDLSDFHQTERIADLPRELDTSGAPDAADPEAGDLAYYAPWGNLALFYRDGAPSNGLVILGHIAGGDAGRLATAQRVGIERAS